MSPKDSGRFSIIPARAFDDNRLEHAALVVLGVLGTYSDRDGYCWPSQQTIADRLGITRPAVSRQIKILKELGYIIIKRIWNEEKKQTHNAYKILFDVELHPGETKPEAKQPAKPEQGKTDVTSSVTSLGPYEGGDVTWIPQTDVTSGCYPNVPLTTHISNKGDDMNADNYKQRVLAAYLKGIEEHQGKVDVSRFPEDTCKTIQTFCGLWNMTPPHFSKRASGEAQDWIIGARDVNDACGEFGLDLLRLYADEFNKYKAEHQGLAPYRVTRPGSIVKSLRGLAAELRSVGAPSAPAVTDKYGIHFDN